MGHWIEVYIAKQTQMVNSNIQFLPTVQGFCIFPYSNKKDDVVSDSDSDSDLPKFHVLPCKDLIYVQTRYFGGAGEQYALLWIDGKQQQVNEKWPINDALEKIGVVREKDNDEFDTIGIGSFRHNDDLKKIIAEHYKK